MESTSTDETPESAEASEPQESSAATGSSATSDDTADASESSEERRTTSPEHDMSQYDSPDEAPDDLLEEIEQERQERLDPDNRPDGAEVDNTDRTFVVKHGRFEDSDVDEELGPFRTEDEA